jgi:hypothetical protein
VRTNMLVRSHGSRSDLIAVATAGMACFTAFFCLSTVIVQDLKPVEFSLPSWGWFTQAHWSSEKSQQIFESFAPPVVEKSVQIKSAAATVTRKQHKRKKLHGEPKSDVPFLNKVQIENESLKRFDYLELGLNSEIKKEDSQILEEIYLKLRSNQVLEIAKLDLMPNVDPSPILMLAGGLDKMIYQTPITCLTTHDLSNVELIKLSEQASKNRSKANKIVLEKSVLIKAKNILSTHRHAQVNVREKKKSYKNTNTVDRVESIDNIIENHVNTQQALENERTYEAVSDIRDNEKKSNTPSVDVTQSHSVKLEMPAQVISLGQFKADVLMSSQIAENKFANANKGSNAKTAAKNEYSQNDHSVSNTTKTPDIQDVHKGMNSLLSVDTNDSDANQFCEWSNCERNLIKVESNLVNKFGNWSDIKADGYREAIYFSNKSGAVQLLSTNTLKILEKRDGKEWQSALGIVHGEVQMGWEVIVNDGQVRNEPIYLSEKSGFLSADEISEKRYFALGNVRPGAVVVFIRHRQTGATTAVTVPVASGKTTYVDLKNQVRSNVRINAINVSTNRPLQRASISLPTLNEEQVTDIKGNVLLREVLFVEGYPAFAQVQAANGPANLYQFQVQAEKEINLSYFDQKATSTLYSQFENAQSERAGTIIGATRNIVGAKKGLGKIALENYTQTQELLPELYTRNPAGQYKPTHFLSLESGEFISINLDNGAYYSNLLDTQENHIVGMWMPVIKNVVSVIQ